MKVFLVCEGEWVAAETLAEAVTWQLANHGEEQIKDPRELTDKEMDTLKLYDERIMFNAMDDHPGDVTGDEWVQRTSRARNASPTFSEALQLQMNEGRKFPNHFACTD